MRFFGRHGVYPGERRAGQPFIVDLEVTADTRAAASTDELGSAVDYAGLYETARGVVEGEPRRLLETVAEEIAAGVLRGFPVREVRVTVAKPHAPLPGPVDLAGVEVVRRRRVRAFLGLGSNLGERRENMAEALGRLGGVAGVRLVGWSSLYETEPVGCADQPWFLNAVAEVETSLRPGELLQAVKSVEASMGRKPSFRWGPRLIDIDVLLYGDLSHVDRDLVIPHPMLGERAFVLVPLAEIAPGQPLPGGGTAGAVAGSLDGAPVVRRLPGPWGPPEGPPGGPPRKSM